MAKARSSRRMRNCKSRNKRVGGGMFGDGSCINCSTIKRKFKKYYYKESHLLCPYVNTLSSDEINALYRELNDKEQTERKVFISCIARNYMHDNASIPADIESGIRIAIKEQIEYARPIEAARQKAIIDHQNDTELHEIRTKYYKQNPHLNQSPVILSTGSDDPFTPAPEKDEDEDNPLPPRIKHPHPTSSGGKSRRRHRRGRTLHKRRKSRKVRKTRCRRK